MAVLIDPPVWWHRGRRWAHLVSDRDLDELHAFAAAAGIPERGFHGDHYDVPEEWFGEMVARGAEQVSSRDLVRRLRAAGLRVTPAQRRGRSASADEGVLGTAPGSPAIGSTTMPPIGTPPDVVLAPPVPSLLPPGGASVD